MVVSTSTSALAVNTAKVIMMKSPCITGKSCERTACTIKKPRPGYEKTTSVSSEPPSTKPSDMPRLVTFGSSALRAAYFHARRKVESPFARPSARYSVPSTATIALRMPIIHPPSVASTTVKTGSAA